MSAVPALDLYARGLLDRAPLRAVSEHGEVLPLALDRYVGAAQEHGVLDRALAPVLDIGCGPGRHVLALARRGIHAVGVDISPSAVALARRRGARVIERSIFDTLPGTGAWGSVLLLDGNIGIGGRPAALLERSAALLRPGGIALVEVERTDRPTEVLRVRLEGVGARSAWFAWARVGAGDVEALGWAAGFTLADRWREGARCFAALERVEVPAARSMGGMVG